MSKFNIFTIDLHVILSLIVATGVYALLLKFLQKHMMFKRKGGGFKGLLNNVQKNCTFLKGWLPLQRSATSISEGILNSIKLFLQGGIFSWMFIAMCLLNQLSFKIKFLHKMEESATYITNILTLGLGVLLALLALRRATSRWKIVLRLALKFPPLVLLPIFGIVTIWPCSQR